jgi:hypothetical protein
MSASLAIEINERPRRQGPTRLSRDEPGSLHATRYTLVSRGMKPSFPLAVLDWPSRLFADTHPMAEDDRFSNVPVARDELAVSMWPGPEIGVLVGHLTGGNALAGAAP